MATNVTISKLPFVKAVQQKMQSLALRCSSEASYLMPVSTPVTGMVLADYGAGWKEHRRFALMTLRNFGLGKQSMEQRILGEIQYTVETLEKSIGTPSEGALTVTSHTLLAHWLLCLS